MVKIRSGEQYVGVEIKLEATWNVNPGTWGTASYQVPFIAEDFHFEDDVFPDSQEFAALGALLGIERGRRIVRGTITCEPQFNNIYFWLLFSQLWGAEDHVLDRSIFDDVTVRSGLNVHGFTPGSGLPVGLHARVFMSGANQSGSIKRVGGLIVNRMVWDDPEGDRPRVSFECIGGSIATDTAAAQSMPALETPNVKFKATDLERAGSLLHFGATQAELNVTGFTITIDRKIEAGAAFKNNISTLDKPGIVATREVTVEISSVLEQDFAGAAKPWTEYSSSNPASKATIAYEADTDAISGVPYAMRWDLPRLVWTDVQPNLSQLGEQPFTATGRATLGQISALTAPHNDHATIPSGGSVDVRALCHVAQGDEPGAGDAKFSSLPGS